jgi:peptidoglycan/xylan/chitin deacetylase (PgdA/CDA1 family)
VQKKRKHWVLTGLSATGGFTACRFWTRRQVRIFAYHGVTQQEEPVQNGDGFFVRPADFERHLRTLKGHYSVLPLSVIARKLIAGEPLPDAAAAITFDDGYANNYHEAAPLLAKYGLSATFFITTGFIDGTHWPWWAAVRQHAVRTLAPTAQRSFIFEREAALKNQSVSARMADFSYEFEPEPFWDFMNWEQVRALAQAGHEIGAHTVSHISLGHEEAATIRAEIADSMERLRTEVGTVSPVFAYPYGQPEHWGEGTDEHLRHQGYIGAVTTVSRLNPMGTDPFRLRRLSITAHHDPLTFRALAAGFPSS